MVSTNQPVTTFLPDVASLLAWTPGNDPYNVASVPLAPRIAQPTGMRLLHCHDLRNGYLPISDMYPQGVWADTDSTNDPPFNVYNFGFWQYVDILCYHGQHRVAPPPPGWINAGHQNGALVIGNIKTYGGDAGQITQMIAQGPGGTYPAADQLVAMAAYYGFDGWFFDTETSIQSTQVAQFVAFLQYLVQKGNGQTVVWYDAINCQYGSNSYDNQLDGGNNCFFAPTGALFPNYWWGTAYGNSASPANSAAYIAQNYPGSPQLAYQVYTGIEVHNPPAQYGGFNAYVGLRQIQPSGQAALTSVGLYGAAWTWENSGGSTSDPPVWDLYVSREEQFWVGTGASHCAGTGNQCISQYVSERSAIGAYPFVTNFNQGNGHFQWQQGNLILAGDWNNLSQQDLLPTYRFCQSSGPATRLTPAWDYSTGYTGGASLAVTGSLAFDTDFAIFTLFQTSLPISPDVVASLTYQPQASATNSQVALVFVLSNGVTIIAGPQGAPAENGWQTISYAFGDNFGGTSIVSVGLLCGAIVTPGGSWLQTAGSFGVHVGEIAILDTPTPPVPPATTGLGYGTPAWNGDGTVSLNLTWDAQPSTRYFNVWQLNGATPQFLGRAYVNFFNLYEFANPNGLPSIVFGIQPVNGSNQMTPLSEVETVTLPWQ